MSFDPVFTREVLLPLAVHAYAVTGVARSCESFDPDEYEVLGTIKVNSTACAEAWSELQETARSSRHPLDSARAMGMLEAVMADSHTFGFVARKGTDVFVCIRGTLFLSDWLHNVDLPLEKYRFRAGSGQVHMGFQAIYKTIRQSILDALPKVGMLSLTLIGHSLGGALMTLCALDEAMPVPSMALSFASPRTGDADFKDTFNSLVPGYIRVVNKPDIAPHLPLPIGYRHVGTAAIIDSGFTLNIKFAHELCDGYLRGLNRTVAAPPVIAVFD